MPQLRPEHDACHHKRNERHALHVGRGFATLVMCHEQRCGPNMKSKKRRRRRSGRRKRDRGITRRKKSEKRAMRRQKRKKSFKH
jgi:hypothetical protein